MKSESGEYEKSKKDFSYEMHRQRKDIKEIKALLLESSHKDEDKKEHCSCHKKVLSHSHNPCFDHKHGHHHDKCFCDHHGHGHGHNPCLGHGHHHSHFHGSCFNHKHGNHHDKCFSHHHGHGHCNDFFFSDHCCGPKAFSHDNCCNKHFSLHLAGLTGDLNFQFFRKKGCCAEVHFECASETNMIVGRVCSIGVDFVDILKDDKTIVTIMKEKICFIHWLDKCNHHGYVPPCDQDDDEEESVEPVEPVELVEPVKSVEPVEPIEPESL